MDILSLPFNHWSSIALQRIRQKVGWKVYTVIWKGYLDKNPAYFGDYQTFFVRISDWFGVFLFHPEVPPEKIRKRIANDINVTRFLEEQHRIKELHSLIEPVKILTCGSGDAPYMCKTIPGKAWFPFPKEDVHAVHVFQLFRAFITDNLSYLKINTHSAWYDIHDDNVILNSTFLQLIESSRSIAEQIDEWSFLPECEAQRKKLADEWAAQWARIHLFDFGSWILPKNS